MGPPNRGCCYRAQPSPEPQHPSRRRKARPSFPCVLRSPHPSISETPQEARGNEAQGMQFLLFSLLGAEEGREGPPLAPSFPYCSLHHSHARHLSVPQITLFRPLPPEVPSPYQPHCCSASYCQLTPKSLGEIFCDSPA